MTVKKRNTKVIRRGDIWYANLEDGKKGSEQGGVRPVLILQNDMGNVHAPTTIIAPISTKKIAKLMPTHVRLNASTLGTGISRESTILLEQVRVIDKSRVQDKIGMLPPEIMPAVQKALGISVGLIQLKNKNDENGEEK
ncbi:hypothetical protein IV73_GL000525 [Weissella kandleri]|uniref:mRNA interferase n=1 Tax=Weissella kandleri TaxID=1616 RepID=A0A0R2JDJ9_9LACO|nr:type II toxin-antitoxin system PemK/MazF family toxin [Weissella kandleri]KRN75361.1 hypothetical protein IV73_GL000525 [Weissella kandleri]